MGCCSGAAGDGSGRVKRLLGTLVCLLLSAAAASSAEGQTAGLVVGEVVSVARERIPGAAVTLEGFGSTVTDPVGRFRFSGVPAGSYRIEVTREGFSTESRHLFVAGGRRNEVLITLSGSGPLIPSYEGEEVVIPIERMGAAILVRALVNDQFSAAFIVDTGATLTAISREAAEAIGIRADADTPTISLRTAGGIVQGMPVQVEAIRVGGAEAREVRAVVLDMPHFPRNVAGLLGLSFLGRFKVTIDVENGQMVLGRP
jgi:clan AA aspartic protease (TIGR02281 family)